MFSKGTKIYSILHRRCPHCHEGHFFVDNNPYNLAKAGDLLDACPVCARKYTPEPGFYYGAMYVSYALGVALFVAIYVATYVLYPSASMWTSIALVLTGLLFATPLIYALSKIIWANLFFKYKGIAQVPEEQQVQRSAAP